MLRPSLLFLLALLAEAQLVAKEQQEVHPKLDWTRCNGDGSCETVNGEIVIDENWRWLHPVDGFLNCFEDAGWNDRLCNSTEGCTAICALDGADYKYAYGIVSEGDKLSQTFKTNFDFAYNVNSRTYLLDTVDRYQTFTLMNNELAFDVDVSTVECGIQSSLYFVAMDADGGMSKYPTNKAGPEYGTGYCDASCLRTGRYVAGKANFDFWIPSETDPFGGQGWYGACCAEFAVWNSNAHSYSMSSHVCGQNEYLVCDAENCDNEYSQIDDRKMPLCDKWGCDINPYRLGLTDFYGKGKQLDTTKNFTVVTRFEEDRVTQFFIQDGKKIETPAPALEGFPETSGITEEYCSALFTNLDEPDSFAQLGGFSAHKDVLNQPMVLAMSIQDDHRYHNLWLDSVFPPEMGDLPGKTRGECDPLGGEPMQVEAQYPRATVVWSNIRFGPIGTTVDVD